VENGKKDEKVHCEQARASTGFPEEGKAQALKAAERFPTCLAMLREP
jgi:hypothetical protein